MCAIDRDVDDGGERYGTELVYIHARREREREGGEWDQKESGCDETNSPRDSPMPQRSDQS